MSEVSVVEETFKRISSHKGVEGILVLSSEGIPIRSTLESSLSVQYAGLVSPFPMCNMSDTCDLMTDKHFGF